MLTCLEPSRPELSSRTCWTWKLVARNATTPRENHEPFRSALAPRPTVFSPSSLANLNSNPRCGLASRRNCRRNRNVYVDRISREHDHLYSKQQFARLLFRKAKANRAHRPCETASFLLNVAIRAIIVRYRTSKCSSGEFSRILAVISRAPLAGLLRFTVSM